MGNDTVLMFLREGDSRLVSDSSHRFNCSALLNNADIATTDRALPRQARTTAATNGRSAPSSGIESTDCVRQPRPSAGSATRFSRTTLQYPPLRTCARLHNHDDRSNSRFSSNAPQSSRRLDGCLHRSRVKPFETVSRVTSASRTIDADFKTRRISGNETEDGGLLLYN